MSELGFSELQTQVETLPFYQLVILKGQVDRMLEKENKRKSDEFVSEGLAWLDSIAGSVHRDIDFEKERAEMKHINY
ncbi:MAG: hypothetical protein J5857_08235 [Treponema sp.]|nr:hypothetical protein [Treponema sp.]